MRLSLRSELAKWLWKLLSLRSQSSRRNCWLSCGMLKSLSCLAPSGPSLLIWLTWPSNVLTSTSGTTTGMAPLELPQRHTSCPPYTRTFATLSTTCELPGSAAPSHHILEHSYHLHIQFSTLFSNTYFSLKDFSSMEASPFRSCVAACALMQKLSTFLSLIESFLFSFMYHHNQDSSILTEKEHQLASWTQQKSN